MIVILNGSPNKNSKTLTLSKSLVNGEAVIINSYDLNINSCTDCKFCEINEGCIFNDDMINIYDTLKETDTLIISSPIYFGSLSDKIMQVINRFQTFFSQKYIRKDDMFSIRNLILVSTQGSPKMEFFNGPLQTQYILSKTFNATNVYSLLVPDADNGVILSKENQEIIMQIKKEIN